MIVFYGSLLIKHMVIFNFMTRKFENSININVNKSMNYNDWNLILFMSFCNSIIIWKTYSWSLRICSCLRRYRPQCISEFETCSCHVRVFAGKLKLVFRIERIISLRLRIRSVRFRSWRTDIFQLLSSRRPWCLLHVSTLSHPPTVTALLNSSWPCFSPGSPT